MTEYSFFGGRLTINPFSVFLPALICVIDKTETAPYFLLAAVFHEAGHLAAVYITGGKISRISLDVFSVTIEKPTAKSSIKKDFLVSAAGVFINAVLFAVLTVLYYFTGMEEFLLFAAANAFVGGYNILPLKFLDGGEILHDICLFIQKEKNNGLIENIFHILTVSLGIIAGSVLVFGGEPFFSLLCIYPALTTVINKVTYAQKAGKTID